MARYSFLRGPDSSSLRGLGSGLIPTPSLGSYSGAKMVAPVAAAAAAAPAAGNVLTRFAGALVPNLIAEIAGGFLRPGGVVPSTATMPVGNKYNLSAGEVQNIVRMADEINFRRRMLGLEEIDPSQIIGDIVETNRLLMKEAGEREYAIEQLRQQGAIQSSLANQIGAGLSAQGGATQQMIASTLQRPNIDPADAELARAF